MENVSDIRLRLAEIVHKAENDEEFHQRLADEPTAVLAQYGIPESAVEEYSQALSQARRAAAAEDDPTGCIHTEGCKDFTCFTSHCPNTCYVSILIDAPDA